MSEFCPIARSSELLAEATPVTGALPTSLRAWERRYGVPVPQRSESGYRLYDHEALAIISTMRRLVDDGWSPAAAAEAVRSGTMAVTPGRTWPTTTPPSTEARPTGTYTARFLSDQPPVLESSPASTRVVHPGVGLVEDFSAIPTPQRWSTCTCTASPTRKPSGRAACDSKRAPALQRRFASLVQGQPLRRLRARAPCSPLRSARRPPTDPSPAPPASSGSATVAAMGRAERSRRAATKRG